MTPAEFKINKTGAVFSLITGLWLLLIFLPALFPHNLLLRVFFVISKESFHQICHQIPEKTFHANMYALPVCARCTGVYCGMFLGSFVSIFYSMDFLFTKKSIIFLLSLPMLIDVLSINLHFYHYSLWIACLTGIIFGFGIFPFILNALEKRKTQVYEQ